ncbi:MAG TPA: PAS domain S-box protein, partial [Spirochaetota bacterium]|nr:PAS domain S-box protein [Spirochaetota bacterium]
RKESKIFIMLIAVFLPLFAGVTTEVVLPLLKIKIPELTGASFIISAALITYLIYKYRLFIPGIEKTTETILLTMSDALFILSLDFKIKRINNATKDMFGYDETELYEKNINSIFIDKENEYLEKTINYCLKNDCIVKDEETFFITRYMEKIPVSFSCSTIKDKNKKKIGILLIVRDITKRKQMEEKINLSNESFINIVEKSTEGVIVLDNFYNILFINPIASRYLGLSQESDVSEFPYDVEENKTFEIEIILGDNNRGVGEVVTIKTFWGKGEAYILTIRDITKRKTIEENLKKSLKEKEAMLSEVHHRIKNNLQIVMSLLKLPQRFYTENNFLENILIDSQNRIKSMALIHEKLYNNREFFSINMKDYITDLIDALLLSYDIGDKIKVYLDIKDIVLNIDNAVSCGLIINELFTNSIKYAFKESKKTENLIRIKFSKKNSDNLLIYGDNGKGLENEKIDENSKSIGFYLINLLIKKRLKGDFEYISKNGLEYKITFNVGG